MENIIDKEKKENLSLPLLLSTIKIKEENDKTRRNSTFVYIASFKGFISNYRYIEKIIL